MQKDEDEEEKMESQNRQDQMSSRKTNVIAMWRHKNRFFFLLGGRAEEGSYKVYFPGLVFVISMRIMVVTNVSRMPKKSDIILDSYRKKEKRCIYL